ncbi:MAG: hypothetical protein GKR89_06870 [Candidatus Latescibacteria bacterium]|nr:hypothetical protein [Candidatus Latescibacterota bacterium]
MEFIDYMSAYFKGEKAIAYYALPIGLSLLLIGGALGKYHWSNEVARGLLILLVVLGVGAVGVGLFIYQKSEADTQRLAAAHKQAPAQTVEEEGVRMSQVNANWIKLKIAWALLLVVGLAVIFIGRSPTWHGVALGLLLAGVLGFMVDIPAERRAAIYTEHLTVAAEKAL